MVRAILIFGMPALMAYAFIQDVTTPKQTIDLKALHAA